MANSCENNLSIMGKKKDIFEFFKVVGFDGSKPLEDFLENVEITLRSWLPIPDTFKFDTVNDKRAQNVNETDDEYKEYSNKYDAEVKYQKETYGVVGCREYNIKTLGCKCDVQINDFGTTCQYGGENAYLNFSFFTPWSPPDAWLKTLIKEYPNLSFDLDAIIPDDEIAYHLVGSNGKIDLEFTDEYVSEDDEDDDYYYDEDENEEEEVLN